MSGKERDAWSIVSIEYPTAKHNAVTAQCRIEAMQSSAAALECRVAPNQGHGNRAAGTGKDALWTAFAACLPSSEGIDVDAMLPSMVCKLSVIWRGPLGVEREEAAAAPSLRLDRGQRARAIPAEVHRGNCPSGGG